MVGFGVAAGVGVGLGPALAGGTDCVGVGPTDGVGDVGGALGVVEQPATTAATSRTPNRVGIEPSGAVIFRPPSDVRTGPKVAIRQPVALPSNKRHWPSETTSTVPSTTLIAVSSSIA